MRIALKQAIYEVNDVARMHIYSERTGYLIALIVVDSKNTNMW